MAHILRVNWEERATAFQETLTSNGKYTLPVPDLTLLFFNPAKDIPEAAETVTSGTGCRRLSLQIDVRCRRLEHRAYR